jgi:hypothetical protein
MTSRTILYSERGLLIDEKFLRGLTAEESARLAQIDEELDRRDGPAAARLERKMGRRRESTAKQISALKARIAKNASDHSQADSAGVPEL